MTMTALCCICGSVRECRRARNRRPENYWFKNPIDRDWHRETGELKCFECGRFTTHALIHPADDTYRDHAEMMQRVATGDANAHFSEAELAEVRSKYRNGLPRNPYLDHLWWCEDAQESIDAGQTTFPALCGEQIPVEHYAGSSPFADQQNQQVRPEHVDDQEYEDGDTGLSWVDMRCVDCLRVWHQELLRRRRKVLAEKLTVFIADMMRENNAYPTVDLQTVNSLIDAIDSAQQVRSKCQGVRQ